MKKILFIMNNLGGGGAEKVLLDLLEVFDYKKYKIDILLVTREGIYIDRLNDNIRLKSIYNPIRCKNKKIRNIIEFIRGKFIRYFATLIYSIVVKENYDVEIAFLEGFPTTYLLANSTNKTSKKIAWVHTDLEKSRTLSLKNEEKMYSKIDKVVCVSSECKDVFDRLYKSQSYKSEIIYNLINKEKIIDKANEKIEYNFTKPTIIGVGRLAKEKRFDILIKAHKLLLEDRVDNELIILGTGELEDELIDLTRKLGVDTSVKLLGFQKNPYPYIKKSDIFVMSSDFEGFSLVVAEAMVLGKVIVSTKCVGPCELLENGNVGIITTCGDEHEMKEAIKKLLTNDKEKRVYSERAIIKSNQFDVSDILNKIYNLLD